MKRADPLETRENCVIMSDGGRKPAHETKEIV